MQREAQARLINTPGLMLWTTTEVLFREQGPLATIWLQGIPLRNQATQPGSLLRQRLFDGLPGSKAT